jgi:Protein tyrosine and serine/threonine kinase
MIAIVTAFFFPGYAVDAPSSTPLLPPSAVVDSPSCLPLASPPVPLPGRPSHQFLGACTKQKPYIVITELMACSLADAFLKTFFAPTQRRQVEVALDFARGMAYLHSRRQPIVHRCVCSQHQPIQVLLLLLLLLLLQLVSGSCLLLQTFIATHTPSSPLLSHPDTPCGQPTET